MTEKQILLRFNRLRERWQAGLEELTQLEQGLQQHFSAGQSGGGAAHGASNGGRAVGRPRATADAGAAK